MWLWDRISSEFVGNLAFLLFLSGFVKKTISNFGEFVFQVRSATMCGGSATKIGDASRYVSRRRKGSKKMFLITIMGWANAFPKPCPVMSPNGYKGKTHNEKNARSPVCFEF